MVMAGEETARDARACTLREMTRRLRADDRLPLLNEAELRAYTRRRKNPLPCLKRGGKRPHVYVFEPVVRIYLAYEMGAADYAEVVEVARRSAMGAWA